VTDDDRAARTPRFAVVLATRDEGRALARAVDRLRLAGAALVVVVDLEPGDGRASPRDVAGRPGVLVLDGSPEDGEDAWRHLGLAAAQRVEVDWVLFHASATACLDAWPEEPGRVMLDDEALVLTAGYDAVRPGGSIVPYMRTWDAYEAARADIAAWLPAVSEVCRRERLRPTGRVARIASNASVALLLPPSHVLKLYVDVQRGEQVHGAPVHAAERTGLGLAARDPGLPVPALVADGTIAANCRYLVMSLIPGVPLADVRPEVGPGDMTELAAWAGHVLGRFHAIGLGAAERRAGHEEFLGFARHLRATVGEAVAARSLLPARLAGELDDWLPSPEALAGHPADAAVLHGSFMYKHVFVQREAGGWRPTGVIDLGAARVGHPLYDLCRALIDLRREPAAVAEAFMAAAGFSEPVNGPLARLALAWLLLRRQRVPLPASTIEEASSLDDLALRAFAAHGDRTFGWYGSRDMARYDRRDAAARRDGLVG
jgi:Ser/Thr protein kinase RdoA (MazF antagonist)